MSDRWDITLKDYKLAVSPNEEKMQDFISEQVAKLAKFTADAEEMIVLRHTPTDMLKRLIALCELELASRSQSEAP